MISEKQVLAFRKGRQTFLLSWDLWQVLPIPRCSPSPESLRM